MIGYEAYYPFRVTSVWWQQLGCLAWLLFDLRCLWVAHSLSAHLDRPTALQRLRMLAKPLIPAAASVAPLYYLGRRFSSENELFAAYYVGWTLQLPLGYLSAYWFLTRSEKVHRIDWWIW